MFSAKAQFILSSGVARLATFAAAAVIAVVAGCSKSVPGPTKSPSPSVAEDDQQPGPVAAPDGSGVQQEPGSDAEQATSEARHGPAEKPSGIEPPDRRRKPGFRDAALESGITFTMSFLPGEQGEKFKTNLYDHGCGVAVADYDGDGHDDIYFLNQLGPNALYKNKGDGTFRDVTEEAGVGLADRICVAAAFGDYDNDGDQDLYVTSTRGGNVLFQNQGNGRFKEVTQEAGLTLVAHSQTASFFDADGDGYLDLLVTNAAKWTTDSFNELSRYFSGLEELIELAASPKEYNVFYHNAGNGTFTDATEAAGLKGVGWGGDVAVFDFDEDGDLDVLVTNMFGRSQLYRNDGHGQFSDVTTDTLGRTSWGAIGSKVFDYNNDGKLDVLIVDMHSDMWMPLKYDAAMVEMIKKNDKRKYRYVSGPSSRFDKQFQKREQEFVDLFQIRYDEVIFGNTLFQNLGAGKFQEVSDRAGMETFWPWGIGTGDFDNDGYEDAYIPSGMGYPYFYWRNYLLMNNGDETFADRSRIEGIEPSSGDVYLEQKIGNQLACRSSRCAATADFDGDGRLEIIVNNFNDHPYYHKNEFPPKNYVAFRLKGSRSNRDAVGSLVRIHVGDEVMVRQVQAAGGYLSQGSKTVHFGLGTRPAIDRVEIVWPSGTRQQIERPQINTLHQVTEPEA